VRPFASSRDVQVLTYRSASYIRMLKSPTLYSVSADYQDDDPGLVQKRADIIHTAAAVLEKCNLIEYERASGRFQSTELGRIASHYYVTHNSMSVYNQHLRPTMSQLELFRVFALSNEFKLIPVRQEVSCPLSGVGGFVDVVTSLGKARICQAAGTRADSGEGGC
jgi:replicative superfamily II helicase